MDTPSPDDGNKGVEGHAQQPRQPRQPRHSRDQIIRGRGDASTAGAGSQPSQERLGGSVPVAPAGWVAFRRRPWSQSPTLTLVAVPHPDKHPPNARALHVQ